MNFKRLSLAVVAAASLSSLALAETIVTPSTPAPTVPGADSAPALVANQTIYTPRLPSAQELTNAASAQGVAIDRIEQTASQITVVYRYGDGRTNTVAYQTLPSTGAPVTVNSTVVPANPPTTVVYDNSPRVVYYDPGFYYDPWYYYPPVAVGFGFRYGYHGGYYRGGGFYHGGFRGGWHR